MLSLLALREYFCILLMMISLSLKRKKGERERERNALYPNTAPIQGFSRVVNGRIENCVVKVLYLYHGYWKGSEIATIIVNYFFPFPGPILPIIRLI